MRLNKQICVAFLGVLPVVGAFASPAVAQLRTGREQRTLYHEELVAQQKPNQQKPGQQKLIKSKPTRGDGVAQASYAEEPVPAKSILEEKMAAPVGSGVGQKTVRRTGPVQQAPAIAPAHEGAVHHDDVIHESVGGEGYYEPHAGGLVSGGCSCGACSSGCDDFADLAPACASACGNGRCAEPMFSGCSPLGSLLSNLSIRAEVPLYWRRAAGPPALVTTSPVGTLQGSAGELGQNTTQILYGNGPINDDANAGFRITLGTSFGSDRFGLLFRYWNAGEQDDTATFSSNQNAILARPFLNTTNGAGVQDTQLVAFPNVSTGSISINTNSDVQGFNLMLRRMAYRDRFTRVDWLYGYQNVSIDESLSINSNTLVTGNANPALTGASIAVSDRFATQNDFNGVTYGFMGDRRMGCWKFESMFRLGLGNLRRRVNVAGSTTTTSAAGASNTEPQGLLARNTNGQEFKDDTFVVLPEVGFNVAYNIRPGLDFNVGYNYMLIPKVAQASRQIDKQLAVNLSDPLTGSLDPQLDFEERKYWLHSLGLGLQWNY